MIKRLLIILFIVSSFSCKDTHTIKLLQFNIWQEGTIVEGGYEALVEELARTDADFVMFSEVRNYKQTRFCDRITSSLKEKGKTYYSFYTYDSGLLSKYPITDSTTIFPENEDHGSIYKLVADMNGQKIAVYTAHLDYQNSTYYDVKGYDGCTWKKRDTPLTNMDSILYKNTASQRDDAIRLFIQDAEQEQAKGHLIFLGGDFNEPSHQDWIEATKDSTDHQGLVIPWTVTSLLTEAGYADAYRSFYTDPVKFPGYTYPANNTKVEINLLSWALEADERERIDYIFFRPTTNLKLKQVSVFGPDGFIQRGERTLETTSDPNIKPLNIWPSDHKGVVAQFEWKQ